ncbi:MAG: beta-phosphoglucomutase [Gammaproteobacteria bacterium HGW-Gammaproteobacteria-4]|nr:MAG: beta-phosphoglucomutase [Gammaproteobacteria bacterium HGW-Gammaproteobacteria-4]
MREGQAKSVATQLPAVSTAGADAAWQLCHDARNAHGEERDHTLFALANGNLGVRAGCEEAGGSGGCFLAEVYERTPIHYHERFVGFAQNTDTRIPVADGSHVGIRVGDVVLDPFANNCVEHQRVLDLRSACLTRTARWQLADGSEIALRVERVVPFAHPNLLCIRLHLSSIGYSGPVTLLSAVRGDRAALAQGDDPRIGSGAGEGMVGIALGADEAQAWLLQQTASGRTRVLCAQAHRVPDAAMVAAVVGDSAQQISATLHAGESLRIEKVVAYAWADDAGNGNDDELHRQAQAALQSALAAGFAGIAMRQAATLSAFWRDAEITIDGDAESAQALRFNLFHVLQSTGRGGHTSTAAKGLTGEGYEGHYFWDTEAYVLPVLALTAPELAKGMLEYRYRTLDRARAHAREMNHPRGALYPWRTISGDECSAYYPSGSAQYHINAAIAYAIRTYMAATGDDDFLARAGAEMLFEMARIWMDIGHFNPRRGGAFSIHEVTGPDEYSALVDNNFYTNRMARAHLRDAVAVWHRLAAQRPGDHARLAAALALDDAQVRQWQRAADAMYLPFDATLGIYAQDDGFLDKPRWNFAATTAEQYPLLLHFHPLTIYRHQVCKQADVVLALVLDGDDVPMTVKRASFDYYQQVTVHDSTLSASAFNVLASEVGDGDAAWRYFQDTVRVDLDDLHGNTGHGAHMAAMAGSWHCLVFGFAGMRVQGEQLHFAPRLPAQWRGYAFSLRWRGRRLHLAVDAQQIRYRLIEGAPLSLVAYGEPIVLVAGDVAGRPLPAAAQWPLLRSALPLQAIIFDLDGVLTDTARVHYVAWKALADALGVEFDETVNRRLKGVDRMGSLEILLERATRTFTLEEKLALCERKNAGYRERIAQFGPGDLLPGAAEVLAAVRAAGLKVALASASRNAPLLLERLGIADAFDFVADASAIERGKPDPEIFLNAARGLGIAPSACLGIEDAAAGVAAIKAAGMCALGIGDPDELAQADAVLAQIADFRVRTVLGSGAGEGVATSPRQVRGRSGTLENIGGIPS